MLRMHPGSFTVKVSGDCRLGVFQQGVPDVGHGIAHLQGGAGPSQAGSAEHGAVRTSSHLWVPPPGPAFGKACCLAWQALNNRAIMYRGTSPQPRYAKAHGSPVSVQPSKKRGSAGTGSAAGVPIALARQSVLYKNNIKKAKKTGAPCLAVGVVQVAVPWLTNKQTNKQAPLALPLGSYR